MAIFTTLEMSMKKVRQKWCEQDEMAVLMYTEKRQKYTGL